MTVAHAANQCSTCRTAFTIWFGSLDVFINVCVIPEIADGKLDALDMVDIVAVLRRWEADGTWDRAHAY